MMIRAGVPIRFLAHTRGTTGRNNREVFFSGRRSGLGKGIEVPGPVAYSTWLYRALWSPRISRLLVGARHARFVIAFRSVGKTKRPRRRRRISILYECVP